MSWFARGLLSIIAAAAVLALPAAANADVTITATCNGTTCSTGWYTTDVTVKFNVSGSNIQTTNCPPPGGTTISTDTAETDVTCTVTLSDNTITGLSVPIKRDATVPTVGSLTLRSPDVNGWYNHPVQVAAQLGTDSVSGATCTTVTYSGPDSGSATVTGTCTSGAGLTSAPKSMTIQYDASPPTVSAQAARPPDTRGWYDHPVGITFSGSNDVSGIASCTSATYSGPDSGSASVSGNCTDKAGNTAATSFPLKYDSSPPTLTGLTAEPLDRGAALSWKQSNAATVTVSRAQGTKPTATVYDGRPRSSWKDVSLRNGLTYTYTVTVVDGAGYAVVRHVTVRPSAPLLAPPPAARVHGATTLRWRPARKAAYYNVQLWRRGAKVLSAWPAGPRFRLHRTWSYRGRPQRLRPGRYVWYVWPGYGPRTRARFGPLVGKSTFVVAP